ncbi:hypothetical protein ACJX0J_012665, partial [Zea mays]
MLQEILENCEQLMLPKDFGSLADENFRKNLQTSNMFLIYGFVKRRIKDLFMSKGTFQVKDGSQTAKISISSFDQDTFGLVIGGLGKLLSVHRQITHGSYIEEGKNSS